MTRAKRKTETVSCATCGEATSFVGTKRCNACWEVESRLRDYLRKGGPKACEFVDRLLAAVENSSA